MKKILKSAGLLTVLVCLPQICFAGQAAAAYQNVQGSSLQENQADGLAQELARNKELLEIWKDHVRTLTRERDEAYQQIENLKSGAAPAQAEGGLGEEEKERYLQTIRDLTAQVSSLTNRLEAVKSQTADASLRLTVSELKTENEKLKLSLRGFQEVQNDQDVIIREKQEALQRIDDLEKQVSSLRIENQRLKSAAPAAAVSGAAEAQRIQGMQDAYDALEADFKDQQDRIRRLQAEKLEDKTKIQELKTQLLKLQSGREDLSSAAAEELREAKAAFEVLRVEKEKVSAQASELSSRVRALETDAQTQAERLKALIAEKNNLNNQITASEQQLSAALQDKQTLQKDNAGLEFENQGLNERIQSLKSDMEQLRLENQRVEGLKADLAKALAEKEALQKSYGALQADFGAQERKFKEYSAKLGELDKANIQLRAESRQISQQNQELRAGLQANLKDIQNLKSNFESYLESLEQSFGEREQNVLQ